MTSHEPSPQCPFCNIANTYPPLTPTTFLRQQDPKNVSNNPATSTSTSTTMITTPPISPTATTAHLILSTTSLLAFLDIMPLTRGHILLATREHYEKLGDVKVGVSREVSSIGQWLPILSRVVMRTLFGASDDEAADWCWNVVQNNGVRAAQQVPHVHFHVIPRPNLDGSGGGGRPSFVMFGRGQRDELDEEEGEELARCLREELAREVVRLRDVEGVDLEGEFAGRCLLSKL
ncbi:HIT-like protein [Aspergillus homomorphus CBS 101889]|uniref:HIT-like protein n=1 Tax=Aspergillus homomorphus (strain CBS 101889) TaxID=1450537 RepID=A0A395IB08_ASPHC|nr:HIT-like protein [Aspergillus homomorphus CBS 101889]RAL17236.1 HIT-like protein [Aspergillus homomorphus CBS 101889]